MAHNAHHHDVFRQEGPTPGAEHHPASVHAPTLSMSMNLRNSSQNSLSASPMSPSAHRQVQGPIFGAFGAFSSAEANAALLNQLISSHQVTSQSPFLNSNSPAPSMSPTYFTPSASQYGSPDNQGTFSPHLATPLDVGHFSPNQHAHPAQFYVHTHRLSSSTSINSIPPTSGVNTAIPGSANAAFFSSSPPSSTPYSTLSSPSAPVGVGSYPIEAPPLFSSSNNYPAAHPESMDYVMAEGKPVLTRLNLGATVLGEGVMAPLKGSLPQESKQATMAHYPSQQHSLYAAFEPQFVPPRPVQDANALQLNPNSSSSSLDSSQPSLPLHLVQRIQELEHPEEQREVFNRLQEWTSSLDPRHYEDLERMTLIVKIMCDWYSQRRRPANADLMSFAEGRYGAPGEAAGQSADSLFASPISPVKAKRGRRKTLEASVPLPASSTAGQRGGPDYYVCLWPNCKKPPLQARTDRVQEETLIHLNLKTHCCTYCDKRYLRNNDLKRHIAKSHHDQTQSNFPTLPSTSGPLSALQSPVDSVTSLRQPSALATRTKRRNPYDRITSTNPANSSGTSSGVASRSASNSPVVQRSAVGASPRSPRSPFPHFTSIDTTSPSDSQLQTGLMGLFQPLGAASTAFPGLNLTEEVASQPQSAIVNEFAQDGTSHERVNEQQVCTHKPVADVHPEGPLRSVDR